MSSDVKQRLYSLKHAAEVLGVSPAFLREQSKAGRIKTVKLGRRRLVPLDELERLETEGL